MATVEPLPPAPADPTPHYDDTDADGAYTDAPAAIELPSYSPPTSPAAPRAPRKFVFELTSTKISGRVWATLTLAGHAALSAQQPAFPEGTPVAGTLAVTLENADAINSVSICVTGRLIHGANRGEDLTFLDVTHPLWTRAMGDPRAPAPGGAPFEDKLQGEYTWTFAVPLPPTATVELGKPKAAQTFRLPASFAERHTRASVRYEVVAVFARGLLRADSHLIAPMMYLPITRPDPPSALRAAAYEDGSALLPGPEADPDGWQAFPARVRGTVFGARTVDIRCTLSLATPLCYTRGSVIPIHLQLDSADDTQAAALLGAAGAATVRLRRVIKFRNVRMKDALVPWMDDVVDSLGAWWAPGGGGAGELRLRGTIAPSAAMATFSLEYFVVLFPFAAAGFVSADTEPLLVVPVEVATAYARGPRPRAFAPPGYDAGGEDVGPAQYHIAHEAGFLL